MMTSLIGFALLLTLQTPDGLGPSIQDPAVQSLSGSAKADKEKTAATEQTGQSSASGSTVPTDPAALQQGQPAVDANPQGGDTVRELRAVDADAVPRPEPMEAPAADKPPAKEQAKPSTGPAMKVKPEQFSGLLVSAMGGAVMVVGAVLASVAAVLTLAPINFPGGQSEKEGATNSAIVGSVFCGLVGAIVVAVGFALVGVSFM